MTAYRFRAAGPDGKIASGVLQATSLPAASGQLAERGLMPIEVEIDRHASRKPTSGRRELAIAFRSVASLVGAGVPLVRALQATGPLVHPPLRHALLGAARQLVEGEPLARALSHQDIAIPPVVLGILGAGERAGSLADALDQASAQLERDAELADRIRQTLAYPLVLLATGIASMLIIGLLVVPRFVALLADLGQDLPASTRVFMAIVEFASRYGPVLIGVAVIGGSLLARHVRTPSGRVQLHRALLELPLLGPIRHGLAAGRFGRSLSGLLATGVPILAALDAAGSHLGDAAVAARVAEARARVAEGLPLTRCLERERVMPAGPLLLFAVGEESGELALMADRAGRMASADAERRIAVAMTLVEPAIILVFGGAVALVALALFQAVYAIRPA